MFPHRLHALSILTGKEMLGGPVLISDPALPPAQKFQRPGLLLANGRIYVAFGSIEDRNPYHGLIFAFDENNLEVVAFFNVTPTGSQGGIWMSGASPTADKDGNIYVSTGNGSVSANNFGQAIVKLSPNLQELDFFIPHGGLSRSPSAGCFCLMDYYRMMVQVANENCQFYQFLRNVVRAP